jgi:hypothetical protein
MTRRYGSQQPCLSQSIFSYLRIWRTGLKRPFKGQLSSGIDVSARGLTPARYHFASGTSGTTQSVDFIADEVMLGDDALVTRTDYYVPNIPFAGTERIVTRRGSRQIARRAQATLSLATPLGTTRVAMHALGSVPVRPPASRTALTIRMVVTAKPHVRRKSHELAVQLVWLLSLANGRSVFGPLVGVHRNGRRLTGITFYSPHFELRSPLHPLIPVEEPNAVVDLITRAYPRWQHLDAACNAHW